MKGRLINIIDKKKKRTKSIVLSVVALLELILLLASVTYSWFEGITSLEIIGQNVQTAAALNSHLEVGENSNNPDDEVTYTNVIDLTDFFDSQSDVRLTPVSSSDAETFYAAYDGVPRKANYKSLHYRELTEEDINANIIRFDFQLSSPHGDTDVYLTESLPVLSINGVEIPYTSTATATNGRKANAYRYAFSDGTETHILRTEDDLRNNISNTTTVQESIVSLKSDDTPVTVGSYQTSPKQVGTVERAQEYAYYTDHRETTTGLGSTTSGTPNGAEIKPLFHLDKGETKTITVTVWHEALDYESLNLSSAYTPTPGQKISFSIKLCTSWSISREITVYDATPENDTNPIKTLYARNKDNDNSDSYQYRFEYNSTNNCWKGKLPIALENCQFVYTRENDSNSIFTTAANPRGSNTNLTILGGGFDDGGCLWGVTPSELTEVKFSDYTDSGWVNTLDKQGNPINISVTYPYGDYTLRYYMSDSPSPDKYGNNTWTCYIPTSVVDDIRFIRSGHNDANVYADLHYWETPERGTETVFRANDGNFFLYVYIDDSVKSLFTNGEPFIAKTGNDNEEYWYSTATNQISRNNYIPQLDTWYTDNTGKMTKHNDNIWYIEFDKRPAFNDSFTIATTGMHDWNDINYEVSFGVFRFKNEGNTIHINDKYQITLSDHRENYILQGTFNSNISDIVGSETSLSESCHGEWGEVPNLPTGNNTNYFVHTSKVEFVKVQFQYNGVKYSITMDTDDGRTWYTDAIPTKTVNGLAAVTTGITFTDSNGNTWTNTGTRSNAKCYYYALSEDGLDSTGTGWRNRISLDNANTYYFKHYDSSVETVTVSYNTTYGVPFTVELTKGSDGYTWSTNQIAQSATGDLVFSDGTNTWTASNSNTTYNYHVKNSTTGYWAEQYFLRPGKWNADSAWYVINAQGGTVETSGIRFTETSTSGLYSAWIPADTTKVTFYRINKAASDSNWNQNIWNQTGSVSVVSDSKTFTITDWGSGSWYGDSLIYFIPGPWDVDEAVFRAWVWGASSADKWIYFVDSDGDGTYVAELGDTYTGIKFLRAQAGSSEWDGEWNHIETSIGGNTYTVNGFSYGVWSNTNY